MAINPSTGKAYVADQTSHEIDVFAPSPPAYTSSFGAFTGPTPSPEALTVDPSNGDIYALSPGGSDRLSRFDSSGSPKNFAATGTNFLTGLGTDVFSANEVAIDRSGGPADGDIYLTTFAGIKVYDNDGHLLTTLDGSGTPVGSYNESCGVAVDQSNGNVYVGDYSGNVWRYSPSGATPTEGDYSGGITTPFNPCQVAADSGHVYAADYDNSGPVKRFSASDFAMADPALARPAPPSMPPPPRWPPTRPPATSTSTRATRSASSTPPTPRSTASAPPLTSALTPTGSRSPAPPATPTSPTAPTGRSTSSRPPV